MTTSHTTSEATECRACGGDGVIEDDYGNQYECSCAYFRRLATAYVNDARSHGFLPDEEQSHG